MRTGLRQRTSAASNGHEVAEKELFDNPHAYKQAYWSKRGIELM